MVLLLSDSLFAAETPSPVPPPPWQAKLDTARALQASLFLTPARDAGDEAARRQRLTGFYRQMAAEYSDAVPVQKAAGDGLAQSESAEAALPYWQRAATLDPNDADLADSLGSAYLNLGRVQEAAAQFQRAVAAQPNVATYHFSLANILYLFRQQLLSPPNLPDQQAVLRLALEHFRRAAELSPGDLRIAKAYAETFYILPDPDWIQALAAWQSVLALSGDSKAFAQTHLARISLRLRRGAEARAYLADVHDPAFDELKTKLWQQAGRLDSSPTPVP